MGTEGVSEDYKLVDSLDQDKRILLSLATPNGHKVAALFEELGMDYTPVTVDIRQKMQFTKQFLSVCPNNKIPAVRDNEENLNLWESCHILLHYADKQKQLIPQDTQGRAECLNWLFWQAACLGPFSGQVGAFYAYGGQPEDSFGVQRFVKEVNRLLGVLDKQLNDGRQFICGEQYTIADIACWPWVRTYEAFYNAKHLIDYEKYPNVAKWLHRCMEREASKKALQVTQFPKKE